jgi:hypothetical protein
VFCAKRLNIFQCRCDIHIYVVVNEDIMKNIYIGKIVEDYFEMRLFILGVVNDVLDSDTID